MKKERYVQAGYFALRSPNGDFLPAVPLFIRESDAGGRSEVSGRTVAEEILQTDVARKFADKLKQYKDGVAAVEGNI